MSLKEGLIVVLLAGGPGGQLPRDILQATAIPPHVESKTAVRKELLHGSPGSEYVALSLVSVSGMHVIESWLTALRFCQRVQSCSTSSTALYVVCNDPDVEETKQLISALPDSAGLSVTVVSNNCSDPAHTWQGEASDLAAATAAIAAATAGRRQACPVLAISCSLLLLPEHNMSRVIEHAVLRGSDVCCYSQLSANDMHLDSSRTSSSTTSSSGAGGEVAYLCVVPAADVPAPPLQCIEGVPATSCQPGATVAEPMLLLRAASINHLPTLVQQCTSLCNNHRPDNDSSTAHTMHGMDIGEPGRLRVESLLWLEYADTVVYGRYKTLDKTLHGERAAVANTGGRAGRAALLLAPHNKPGNLSNSSSTGPVRGLASSMVKTSKAAAVVAAKQVDADSINSDLFFKRIAAVNAAGIQQPYYHLPPTFFGSGYARSAATAAGLTLAATGQCDVDSNSSTVLLGDGTAEPSPHA